MVNQPRDPEVGAARLYDLLQDELRANQPGETVAELAMCMLIGAYLAGTCHSDTEVNMAVKRIGNNVEHYYEKSKQYQKRQRDAEREVIKLNE